MSFYKYYHPDSVGFILTPEGVSARFSQSKILNDPFEMNPATTIESFNRSLFIEQAEKLENRTLTYREINILEKTHIEKYLKSIHKLTEKTLNKDFGIFSLSKDEKSNTLWSYYSQDHKGFMIEFKESEGKVSFAKQLEQSLVNYNNKREQDFLLLTKKNTKEMKEIFLKIAFTKDGAWRHENEYRIFSFLSKLENSKTDNEGFPIFTLTVKPHDISRIVLGIRSSKSLKRKVIHWILSHKDCNISLQKAVVPRTSFQLEYENIDLEQEEAFKF